MHQLGRTRTMTIVWVLISALPVLLCASASEETYVRELPSGAKVVCDRCQPGTHLRSHCTGTRRTDCGECGEGFYTEFWNYITECLPCDLCTLHQEETRPCTRTHNRACQCKEGYYWLSHFCKKHAVCPSGHGVKTEGTPLKDTECEPCQSGHYAAETAGSTRCSPHTACKGEEKLVINGTSWHDNVCVTCDNITTKGWPTFIKPLLSELFAQKHRRIHRLERLLSQSIGDQQTVQQWLNGASEKQLTDLPSKLEKVNMQHLAAKVEHKVKRFQEEAKYCSNSIM